MPPNTATTYCPVCDSDREMSTAYVRWSYTVVRCPQCGLGKTMLPPDFQPDLIYNELYFQGGRTDGYADYQGSEPVLRAEFRAVLADIARLGFTSGRLLEMGCAYGFFLSEAASSFTVKGIEISSSAVEFCRARGLDVVQGVLRGDTFSAEERFDVIVMLDVIEHLTDPSATVKAASKLLRRGGLLLISTGDWHSPLSILMGRYWRLMTPPQHTFFFSPRSLGKMLANADFKVFNYKYPWKTVPAGLIVYQLFRLFGREQPPQIGKGTLGIPVNLFDAFRIAAIKE